MKASRWAALALLAGVLAACVRRSYTRFLEDLEYLTPDPVSHPSFGTSKLAQMRMLPVNLTEEELALWNQRGYVVVRGAVPSEAVAELAAATREMFGSQRIERFSPQHQESFFMRAFQLTLQGGGALADLVLHRDLALGGLAAQLLRAESVRVGNLGLNGVSTTAPGSKWHLDIGDVFNKDRARTPADSAVVRLWLPLWPDEILADSTGGSLVVMPLNDSEHYRVFLEGDHGPCFQEIKSESNDSSYELTDHCSSWMQGRIRTPDVAVGDVVLYSPKIWHKSQPIRQGNRLALTGQFYDPDKLAPIVEEFAPGHARLDWDVLGVIWNACVDFSQRTRHRSQYWQSADGPLVSGPSACFPQVFPSVLEREVQDIALGRVRQGSQRWYSFLMARALPLCFGVGGLEYLWGSWAPGFLREPTKAFAYTLAEWLGPLLQRATSLS